MSPTAPRVLNQGGAQQASCSTGVAYGTIIRNSETGWAGRMYAGSDGVEFLAHIETSETYRCLVGLGTPVRDVTTRAVEAFVIGKTPEGECLNPATYAGHIVRSGDGTTTHLVDPKTSLLRPIRSGGTYLCLSLWADVPIHPDVLTASQLAKFAPGADAICNSHVESARNRIVTATDGGHSIYVDGNGTAHNIQTLNAYSCLRDAGVTAMTVPDHTWQQAFAYGNDQPGCRRILKAETGASYLDLPDDRVLWLPDTQTYYCNADTIAPRNIVTVTQATVDGMGVDGHAAKCLSPARYENMIVRDSNGRAVIVQSGKARSIPDGHSWSCYLSRGVAIGENSISPTHLDSIPTGTRMPYCLNKSSYVNVVVKRSDGAAYKTNSAACAMHIGNGWTYNALVVDRGVRVAATGLNSEHIASLGNCGTHPWMFDKASFRNAMVRQNSNGAVFAVGGDGCRRHIRDWYTVERYDEAGWPRKHWTAADSEIASLPYCGLDGFKIPEWRIRNKVVRGPDGTSWFVRWNGSFWEWHWIQTGDLWWHLVNRYGLAPGTYDWNWDHINYWKNGRDRGNWARYW